MTEVVISESFARQIFEQAMVENRCAELLTALFDGGSATISHDTGRLVIATADMLRGMAAPDA